MRRGARDPFLRKKAYAQSVYAPARICPAMHHIHTFSFFRKELCNKKQPAVFTPRAAIFSDYLTILIRLSYVPGKKRNTTIKASRARKMIWKIKFLLDIASRPTTAIRTSDP